MCMMSEQSIPFKTAEDAGTQPLWDVLRNVVDPELHMNIVDLGLVYEVTSEGRTADVKMTLTSPGCPYGPYILHDVDQNLKSDPSVEEVNIDIVWDPPWTPERMTEEARLELGFDL